jgi:hypothetical protein
LFQHSGLFVYLKGCTLSGSRRETGECECCDPNQAVINPPREYRPTPVLCPRITVKHYYLLNCFTQKYSDRKEKNEGSGKKSKKYEKMFCTKKELTKSQQKMSKTIN